jgi:dsDNA-specific endonuclease/ATPase MutS2
MIDFDDDDEDFNPEGMVDLPVDGVLDLHAFKPRDAQDLVRDYIEACLEKGLTELRIIHGKGTGALRKTVHAVLEKDPRVARFELGAEGSGSWGATLVWLKPPK